MVSREIFRRYTFGDCNSSEFGFHQNGQNYTFKILKNKRDEAQIITNDRCYDSRTRYDLLNKRPFLFTHKVTGWILKLGYERNYQEKYTLEVNCVEYNDLAEAFPRERAALARSLISMKMYGPKKTSKFGLLLKGKYIGVSVELNTLTKFGKLAVGKHVVTAKQHNTGDLIFPLVVAVSGLSPLTKVWVDYLPYPKNIF